MTSQALSWVAPGVAVTITRAQWVLTVLTLIVGGLILVRLFSMAEPMSPPISDEAGQAGSGTAPNSVEVMPDPSVSALSLSGNAISILSPGSSSPIHVSFTNQNDHPVIIDRLSVTVQVRNAPKATTALPCTVDDFSVGQFSGSLPLVIPARSMTSLAELGIPESQWPAVGMRQGATNQNGCQLASLSLGFTASGRPSV